MTAPVITSEIPPVEETAPVVPVEEKPKPTKRGSIFGNFVEKLKSPTQEKKEADLVPAVPAKDSEVAAEAPKVDEPAATTENAPVLPPVAPVEAAPLDGTTEALKVEEPKETKPAATTPHKESKSFSFGKFLSNKEKVKSPATEKAPELPKSEEAPKLEETPAVAAPATVEPTTEAPKEEAAVAEPTTEAATTAPTTKEKKRGSIFGALGSKKEGEGKGGFGGLFRAASKAGKPKKEKEATEPKEEKTEVAPIAEETKATTDVPAATATEPATIGDVTPEAVAVGQDSKSTPQVSATA